jgi:hypothetical protein
MSESHPKNPFAPLADAMRAVAAMHRAATAIGAPISAVTPPAIRSAPDNLISSRTRAALMLDAPRRIAEAPSAAARSSISTAFPSALRTGSLTGRPEDRSSQDLSPAASRHGDAKQGRAGSVIATLPPGTVADGRAERGSSAGQAAASAESRARDFLGRAASFQMALRAAPAVERDPLAAAITAGAHRIAASGRVDDGAAHDPDPRAATAHLDRIRALLLRGGEFLAKTAANRSALASAPAARALRAIGRGDGAAGAEAGRRACGAGDISVREAIARALKFVEPRTAAPREPPDRGRASAGAITINSAPNITVNMPAAGAGAPAEREISRAVADALDGHAERIYEIVARVGAMRARTEF